jgi:diguanylate cyclase (GGDEF)-like protein
VTKRAFWSRALQALTITAYLALLAFELPTIPGHHAGDIVLFGVLTLLAFRLRIRYANNFLGLEAAAIFPLIIILRSPGAALLVCGAADFLSKQFRRPWRASLSTLFDVSQLSLSYGLAAMFYESLTPAQPTAMVGTSLYIGMLLLFFFVNTALVFAYLELGRLVPREKMLEIGLFQFLSLLVVSPIVAVETMIYPQYGYAGLFLAFLPVAMASVTIRSLSSIEQKYREVSKQNRELEVMREISPIFAGLRRSGDRYDRLYRSLRRVLPCEAAAFIQWEENPSEEISVTPMGNATSTRDDILAWIEQHHLAEMPSMPAGATPEVRQGEERTIALAPDTPYQVIAPLRTVELISGLIIFESSSADLITQENLSTISVLADHIALVLQDRVLREQMQAINERLSTRAETLARILEISNELKGHLALDQVLQNIVSAVSRSLGFHVVLLSLYDRTEDVFERRAHVGLDRQWEEIRKVKVPARAITRYWIDEHRISKSYFVDHRSSGDLTEYDVIARPDRPIPPPATGTISWHPMDMLWIPLTAGDDLIGCISVDEPKDGRVPSLETVQALEIFANQAVTAIQTARSYEQTRQQTIRDGLTEAYNHRHFQETLFREITRADRASRPLTLAMIDIDDFKSVNDRYGHPVGDAILKAIVAEMRDEVREIDVVSRYGGEEFTIILPDTSPEDAAIVAERVRRRIHERIFRVSESPEPLQVTVSVGLATFPDHAQDKASLIERADAALYRAKRSGKNLVVRADRPSGEPVHLPS